MVSTAIAFVFLRERLSPIQWLAVGLAASGVAIKIIMQGNVPTVSLLIAFSWSGYSLMKKTRYHWRSQRPRPGNLDAAAGSLRLPSLAYKCLAQPISEPQVPPPISCSSPPAL
ncbi:MAG: hypothetical protein LR015_13020 [Verrucomicrobia bacterium]|nr:hypothetical protein [Verrucomicrobiota bacterium]